MPGGRIQSPFATYRIVIALAAAPTESLRLKQLHGLHSGPDRREAEAVDGARTHAL